MVPLEFYLTLNVGKILALLHAALYIHPPPFSNFMPNVIRNIE